MLWAHVMLVLIYDNAHFSLVEIHNTFLHNFSFYRTKILDVALLARPAWLRPASSMTYLLINVLSVLRLPLLL